LLTGNNTRRTATGPALDLIRHNRTGTETAKIFRISLRCCYGRLLSVRAQVALPVDFGVCI